MLATTRPNTKLCDKCGAIADSRVWKRCWDRGEEVTEIYISERYYCGQHAWPAKCAAWGLEYTPLPNAVRPGLRRVQ